MPYCPTCRIDYPNDATRCAECGGGLQAVTPEADADSHEIRLAVLARFATSAEADMVREILESNAIHTVLRGEVDPISLSFGPAPTALMVAEDDYERAEEIFEAFFAGKGSREDLPPADGE